MGNTQTSEPQTRLTKLGPNFWNIRAEFKIFKFVNIGTHMSIVQRENGKFIVIDTVPLDPPLKNEIDQLTNNGEDIEAVIATHPFHTLAFPGFYEVYPKPQYYGTPRHRRNPGKIPWLPIEDNLKSFEPDIQMRIPAGAEFVNPQPESYNHFNAVWVFSPHSRIIHVDDTIGYSEQSNYLFKLFGMKEKSFNFHMSLRGPALLPAADSPVLFRDWMTELLNDWDFDSACCAHNGNKIGGAKELLRQTLEDAQPLLEKLAANRAKYANTSEIPHDEELNKCPDFNVEGNECG